MARNIFKYNVLKRYKSDALVKLTIMNLSENQLGRLKIRFNDEALEHGGNFCFEPQNTLYVESIDSAHYSLGLKSVRFALMQSLSWFFLRVVFVALIVLVIFIFVT